MYIYVLCMCVCDVVVAEVEVQYSQLDYTQLLDRYILLPTT